VFCPDARRVLLVGLDSCVCSFILTKKERWLELEARLVPLLARSHAKHLRLPLLLVYRQLFPYIPLLNPSSRIASITAEKLKYRLQPHVLLDRFRVFEEYILKTLYPVTCRDYNVIVSASSLSAVSYPAGGECLQSTACLILCFIPRLALLFRDFSVLTFCESATPGNDII
jgi:hypothetical protein